MCLENSSGEGSIIEQESDEQYIQRGTSLPPIIQVVGKGLFLPTPLYGARDISRAVCSALNYVGAGSNTWQDALSLLVVRGDTSFGSYFKNYVDASLLGTASNSFKIDIVTPFSRPPESHLLMKESGIVALSIDAKDRDQDMVMKVREWMKSCSLENYLMGGKPLTLPTLCVPFPEALMYSREETRGFSHGASGLGIECDVVTIYLSKSRQ